MNKTQLGDRMKDNYEKRARTFLTRRTPVIMRLDGKAFHTFTKGMKRPFDENLNLAMRATTKKLCEEIQGAKCGYTQSDEISILITDYDKFTTSAWFDYNVQKMCSISAATATIEFNKIFFINFLEEFIKSKSYASIDDINCFLLNGKIGIFDSRVFNIPKEEVNNYFIWRQKDWERNSIQLVGQANYSHKQLHQKSCNQIREMLLEEKNISWWALADKWKNGSFCAKGNSGWYFTDDCPIFTDDSYIINDIVFSGEA